MPSTRRSSAQPDLLEGAADPGALIFARLQAARTHQPVGVLVPAAFREIVPQDCGRSLRLLHDAERHIALREPHQRLLDVARRLVLGDNNLETVDRAGVVAAIEVIATDG